MIFRKTIIFLIASLILNISYAPLLQGNPKTQFSIIYTNDVMGEVEPCG